MQKNTAQIRVHKRRPIKRALNVLRSWKLQILFRGCLIKFET